MKLQYKILLFYVPYYSPLNLFTILSNKNISATSKPEDENKQDETTSVTETSDTQQEDSRPSAPLESKQQTEATNKPVTATKNRKSKNTASRFALNGMKTENGIVVNVPMDDYMQLMMLKIQTGRTLKDLALQAIHEFVEKNKM